MRLLRALFAALLLTPFFAAAALPGAALVATEQVRAELVAHAPQGVQPGQPLWLGLAIQHQPHWHTYWKNPGDSGLPTTLQWTLPDGFKAGEIEWPTPKRLPIGPLMNHGYEGRLLLPVKVEVPAGFAAEALTVKLRADWLVCKDVCIPEGGDFTLAVPARSSVATHAADFDAAFAARPRHLADAKATASVGGSGLALEVTGLPAAWSGKAIEFFPEAPGVLDNALPRTAAWNGERWTVRVPLSDQRVDAPARMDAVLAAPGEVAGVRIAFDIAGNWPAAGTTPSPAPAAAPIAAGGGAPMSLAAALLFALVGGALLNLMPCVFPVLSLKILSFAQHSGSAANGAKQMRQHGIFYAVGVVLSFLALAGALLALKGAGSAIGWGFQLQNPGVVWVLAVIFFLIGLNLMGAFEVGQLAPSSLLSMQAKHPGVDAFFSGVLAVIAASPCTAPFMGAALGFALTQSAAAALAVFAALGLGMALPYVLLAWFPKWLDKLPRPGPWMVNFKQVLAFPMFVTVVWLVWVLSLQAGADGAAIGLLGLVGLAFGAWLIGSMRPTVRWVGVAAALVAAVLAWPAGEPAQTATSAATGKSGSANWQPWDPAAVAKLNAEGKPVFVDFTAAWCVSCQANKRLVLTRAEIEQAFAAKNVTLMRADWTNRDERITQALTAMGRSGVPVYVLHAPGKPAQLLPELLTTGIVKEALAAL